MFADWAHFVYRRRVAVVLASAAVFVAALLVLVFGGTLSSGMIEGIEAQRGVADLERALGRPGGSSFTVIFTSTEWTAGDPRFVAAMHAQLAPIAADAHVLAVETPDGVPGPLAAQWRGLDGHSALAHVTLRDELRKAAREYPRLKLLLAAGPLHTTFTGHLAFMRDLDAILEQDLIRAELVSLPIALLVLVLVFGSLVAASLPLGVGGVAILAGIAAVLVLSRVTDMAQYTINVVSLIGLGVAIDYSLFIGSRFKEELERGASTEAAVVIAVSTAGRAVAFSGLAVGIGLGGLLFFPRSYLFSMGLAGGIVVFLAVFFALTFLPALLALLGPRVRKGRLPFKLPDLSAWWQRLANGVMAHPILVLVPVLGLVLLVGAPLLRLDLAAMDVRGLPAAAEARRGEQMIGAQFPDEAANRIAVVVHFPGPPLSAERVAALYDLSRRLAALPGVRKVESVVDLDPRIDKAHYQAIYAMPEALMPADLRAGLELSVGGDLVVLAAVLDGPSDTPQARAAVRAIRAERAVGDGRLEITGATANDLDTTAFILGHTPAAVTFVVITTTLVLFLLLGSVVLPLKAVLMNLLSIAASFGALVWIFQEGHLSGLLGFEPRPIEPTLPVLLFCVIFGMSMDYEVLLLSRIKEEHDAHGDNRRSVAEGLAKSGGLITSAAAIMVAVFVAFASARVVVVKAMGVGMALAVALDATLVRVLIVPATMRLFGEFNWWAPAWVRRLLGRT